MKKANRLLTKKRAMKSPVLNDIELSIEDDVGKVIAEKLAGITNKAFSKQLSLDSIQS